MAFPPAVLPTNRTNATAQQDLHPADHNNIAAAINDTVAEVQAVRRIGRAVGFTSDYPATPNTSVYNVPNTGVSFTMVASRWYRTTISLNMQFPASAGIQSFGIINGAGTVLIQRSITAYANALNAVELSWDETGLAGAATRQIFIQGNTGTVVLGAFQRSPFTTVDCIG